MKSLVLSALVFFSATASMAATTTLNCQVPATKVAVKMTIELSPEASVDYVTMTLVEPKGTTQFFAQLDPGEIDNQLKQGFLQMLAMTEQTGQVDGVIVNTGFLALGKEAAGGMSGFLSAKGNIYPLNCR
jgi:hypothetical protein